MRTKQQIDDAIDALLFQGAAIRAQAVADGHGEDEECEMAETLEGWAAVLAWVKDDGSRASQLFARQISQWSAETDQVVKAYKDAHGIK